MIDRAPQAIVSVLLPTFRTARFLAAAIDSIQAQTHAPDEIIVLDDGSTDGAAAICAARGAAVIHIQLTDDKGHSSAINDGLARAVGDFIWIVDDDHVALPDALENLLRPMTASPDVGFTYGGLRRLGGDAFGQSQSRPPTPPKPFDNSGLFIPLMEGCFIAGLSGMLVRRSCFDAIGPIDETVLASADYHLLLQIARRFEGLNVGKTVAWRRRQAARRRAPIDARRLSELLPQLGLEEFLGGGPENRPMTATARRQALFQKAVICARSALWPMAIQSLARARAEAGEAPLNARDRRILSKMLGHQYGTDPFITDRRLQLRLSAAVGRGPVGAAIREAIASGLPFRIGQAARRAHLGLAARAIATLLRLKASRSPRPALQEIGRKVTSRLTAAGEATSTPI